MQFSLIPQDDGRFSFQVQDESELPILNSPVFSNRENCIASIRGFIDLMRSQEAVVVQENEGRFYFELIDEAGILWMKSLDFDKRDKLEDILRNLREKASDNTSFEVSMRKQKKDRRPTLPKEIDYAQLYDFSLVAKSKKLGFHPIQSEKDKKYYFLFNNAVGNPILYSRAFSSPKQRDNRIRAIIKQASKPQKYELFQNDEGSYFILKGSNGKEIARSGTFPDADLAESARSFLQDKAPAFEKKFPEIPKTPKKQVNIYRTDQASTSGTTGFDPFQAKDGMHFFHFNDLNASPLIFSEGYTSSRSRNNGIKSLIRNAGLQNRYEKKKNGAKPYFILRAGNRQEIARSKDFEDEKEMQEAIEWLRVQIPRYAAEYGVSLDTEFLDENFSIEVEREEAALELPPVSPNNNPEPSPGKDSASTQDNADFSGIWSKIWPWLLLAIAILILYLLFRSCDSTKNVLPPSTDTENSAVMAAPSSGDTNDSSELPASSVAGDRISEEEPKLENSPDAGPSTSTSPAETTSSTTGLSVSSGSMLARMENFLKGSETGKSPVFIMDYAKFPYNSPKLNKEAEKELDDLTKLLNQYPNAKVEIWGHIDLNEDDYYSGPFAEEFLTLSSIRARCIYKKLIERGIAKERLSFEGFANRKPVENQNNPVNRRLELVLEK